MPVSAPAGAPAEAEAAARAALDRLTAALPPGRPDAGGPSALGVAISGGGDSAALLRFAAGWARARGARLEAATVDHRLREGSAADAEAAAATAARLGVPCARLVWSPGWDGRGNLQEAAREARTRLLAAWAAERGLAAVALGHTLDDQAETLLLRLARGSGVDGLSAMAEASRRGGAVWLRPLLGLRRAALRDTLRAAGLGWREDPSNADPRFDRVRARAALDALAPLGIAPEGLAATAARMGRARAALEAATAALAGAAAETDALGVVRLSRPALRAAPEELSLRLLAEALSVVSGAARRPRFAALARLHAALLADAPVARTLFGCVLSAQEETAIVAREARPAEAAPPGGPLWDGRWRVRAAAEGEVSALGQAGLRALACARREGRWTPPRAWAAAPEAARRATPALWRGGALAAAPLARHGAGLEAALAAGLGRRRFLVD